jgi:hypothetical protein
VHLLPSFAGAPGARLADVRAVNDDVAIASVIDEFGEVSTILAVELEQRRLLDANSQPVNGEASVVALAGRRTGRTACARRGARACRGRRGFGGFLDGGQHADVVDHDQVGRRNPGRRRSSGTDRSATAVDELVERPTGPC